MTTRQAIAIAEEYDRQVAALEDDVVRQLDNALRAGFDQLEERALQNYDRFAATSPFDNRRQREITRVLGESLTLIDSANADSYIDRFERLYSQTETLGNGLATKLIRTIDRNSTVQAVTGVNVAAVADVARESWRDLQRYGREFADSAVNIIGGNIAAGGNRRTATTALRNRLGLTASHAETMVRTRTMSALNGAANKQYEEAGLKSQWLAVGDERMCPWCGYRNTKVFEPKEIRIPAHHRCRCVAIPWSAEWAELGLTSDKFLESYYDEGIAIMRAAGNEPDDSLSSFERAAGLTQVPRIVWAPGLAIPNNMVRAQLAPLPPSIEEEEDPGIMPGLEDPNQVVSWERGNLAAGTLNGVPLSDVDAPNFSQIPDVDLANLPPLQIPPGKALSTGVVILEPDGRTWVVAPANQFGGYENTFPKGRVEDGLTHQQNAIKEAFEESGLRVRINGFLGDFEGDTTLTRYFVAERIAGHPGVTDWETAAVRLAPLDNARSLLNRDRDRNILEAIERYQRGEPEPTSTTGGFPDSIDRLEQVRRLGGSTGAVLMRDPDTGQQFVMKRGASPEHLDNEIAADNAYRALGMNAPELRRYVDADGNPVKLAEFIPGRSLDDILQSGNQNLIDRVVGELQEGFAADALLGNWDVIGMNADNIIFGDDGKLWRIDNGGSLSYRAQGAGKGDDWNGYPTELWTLRQFNRAFQDLDSDDIFRQVREISDRRQDLLDALPEQYRDIMARRIDESVRAADISRTMRNDSFTADYVDTFLRHNMGIRRAGISDRLPTEMQLSKRNVVFDQNGRRWDHLRGRNSIVRDVERYINENGGDYSVLNTWMEQQGRSSWYRVPQAMKAFMAENRNLPPTAHWWRDGIDSAKESLSEVREIWGDRIFNESAAAWHAWNYELFSGVRWPGNDGNGTVRIFRTEAEDVLYNAGVRVGPNQTMTRGALESSSLFTPIEAVAGREVTVQSVPWHRFFGNYMQARNSSGTGNTDAFLGDSENEALFVTDNIPFEYLGTLDQRTYKEWAVSPNYSPPPKS